MPADDHSPDDPAQPRGLTSRAMLAKRVTDVVCLPASEITPQERQLAGDLLVEILMEGGADLRRRCARRVAPLSEPPHRVLRLLARDEIDIARPILEDSDALTDADLVEIAQEATQEHRLILAGREKLGELVAQALVEAGEGDVIRALLKNPTAHFYHRTLDTILSRSRRETDMAALLLRRPELRPSHALTLFWWSGAAARREILLRFGAERRLLQDACDDVFAVAATEGWSDPLVRKALQFIDRRQRNRLAIDKSPYDSLEDAVRVGESGLTRELVAEISYLSGLKPVTGAQIFTDAGGEPLAVLCKATGLKRPALEALWRGLKRPGGDLDRPSQEFARVVETFDVLSNEKAQTVLRYWNWTLSSALSDTLIARARAGERDEDALGLPGRTAALVFDF